MLYSMLFLDAMHRYYHSYYALSPTAYLTLLRCSVFFLSIVHYVFLLLSKKGENYLATTLLGYTDRGSIK